jgi:hypothetical protein
MSRPRVEFEMFQEIDDHVGKLKSPRFKRFWVKTLHCYLWMSMGLQWP